MARALALDGDAVFVQVGDLAAGLRVGGHVAAPEIGARAQQVELRLVGDRNGVLGRAAHRLAAIVRRAFAAAIEPRYGRLELPMDAAIELDARRARFWGHDRRIEPRGAKKATAFSERAA